MTYETSNGSIIREPVNRETRGVVHSVLGIAVHSRDNLVLKEISPEA